MRELTNTEIERFEVTGFIPELKVPMKGNQIRDVSESPLRNSRQNIRAFAGFSNKRPVSRLGLTRTA